MKTTLMNIKNKKTTVFFALLLQICSTAVLSQPQVNIKTNKARDIFVNSKVTVYNKITNSNKNKVLLINKYLDVKKTIHVKAGSNFFDISKMQLSSERSFNPFYPALDIMGFHFDIYFRVFNGQLFIHKAF